MRLKPSPARTRRKRLHDRLRRWVLACVAAAAAVGGAGCATSSATDGPSDLAPTGAWRIGLAFSGQPELSWPWRLKPGAAGDAIPWAEGLALSLVYPPSWLWGGPLWIPAANAAEYAACRDAASAAPERIAVRLEQLARWPVTEALTDRLALRVTGRGGDRVVVSASAPAAPLTGDTVPLLAAAAARGLQAVVVFEPRTVEVRRTSTSGCGVGLFIDGRVRALHVPDGAALSMPPLDLKVCRHQVSIPLERFLRDDDDLRLAMEVAADCIVREILEWTDRARRRP